MTYRGSKRKAFLWFLRSSTIALSILSFVLIGAQPPFVIAFLVLAPLFLFGFASEARNRTRDRLELDEHECRLGSSPAIAIPYEDIRLAYATADSVVLVTRDGPHSIPDRFGPSPAELAAEFHRRMPWLPPFEELLAAQRKREGAVVRDEGERKTGGGRVAALVFAILAVPSLLLFWELAAWAGWMAVLSLTLFPRTRERRLLVATREWVIDGDWAVPASKIRDVYRSGDDLVVDCRTFPGWGDLDLPVREALGIVNENEVYEEEAAKILGLTAEQFAKVSSMIPRKGTRYDRDALERFRARLR